ncbi:hypothetical protein, partial [Streptomyces sp. NPDC056670]|uniref:hypothetical protein n=1 Tax=Streptomyces sp. NPDC056670 TaxID=3345904 RepID=UPI0036BC3071
EERLASAQEMYPYLEHQLVKRTMAATETVAQFAPAKFDEKKWQAEWDSRPEGADVSDLIEITPAPARPEEG